MGQGAPPDFPGFGPFENQRVISRLHPVVAHVGGVVPGFSQSGCDESRKQIIDEKSQEAEPSGSSRSHSLGGVAESLVDILRLQVRIGV